MCAPEESRAVKNEATRSAATVAVGATIFFVSRAPSRVTLASALGPAYYILQRCDGITHTPACMSIQLQSKRERERDHDAAQHTETQQMILSRPEDKYFSFTAVIAYHLAFHLI